MAINIQVYNANQIGGCFTVITTSKACIMIDYGKPLPGTKNVQEEFDWSKQKVDAVFFTHYHGDHVGRITEIPPGIPLYMGSTIKKVLLNIHRALSGVTDHKGEHQKVVELLESDRIKEVSEGEAVREIAGMEITPYTVDHSAYDAHMYLIEADGKVVLHTGDFRDHGPRGEKLLPVIKEDVHKNGRKVDYLIIEGTMIGDQKNEVNKKESQIQDEAEHLFKQNKYAFLVVSSTNIDSLASFCKAAETCGMYTYCYSHYLLVQLKDLSQIAGSKDPWYIIKNIYTVNLDMKLRHQLWDVPKTQEELMREHGFLCILKPGEKSAKWIERFQDKKPWVIYSMWKGYLDPKMEAYNQEWAEIFCPI